MTRDVYAIPSATEGEDPKQPPVWEKLAGFFPAEALAMYASLEAVMKTVWDPAKDANRGELLWSLSAWLVLAVVLSALIFKQLWGVKRRVQTIVGCSALVVYVAALGGPFAFAGWYHPAMGLVASIILTGFILVLPAPTKPPAP